MNEISLEVLNLSAPVHNCLYRADIKTIGVLLKYQEYDKDFLKIKHLTDRGRKELMTKLNNFLQSSGYVINLDEKKDVATSTEFKSAALSIVGSLIDENTKLFNSIKAKKEMLLLLKSLNGNEEEKEILLSIKAMLEENNNLKSENEILDEELGRGFKVM